MSFARFTRASIAGISVVVPKNEINIYDELSFYENSKKKVDRLNKMVGFWKRRVGEPGVTASDYAVQAAEKLFLEGGFSKNDVDLLIYVCQRPDFSQPATAFYIHHKLNLSPDCAVLDVHHGCPGWVYGLWLAYQAVESGSSKKVLLLVGDTPATGLDINNRISAPVFGDGGVATLIVASDDSDSFFEIQTFSEDFEAIITPAGGHRIPLDFDSSEMLEKVTRPIKTKYGHMTRLTKGQMDGLAVFDFTIKKVPLVIKTLLQKSEISLDGTDYLLLHQANKQIVSTVARMVGFSEKKAPYQAFQNFGNNTMCSIPTSINFSLKEELKERDLNVVISAFGNGLAVASAALKLRKGTYLSGVCEFEKPKDFKNIEENIDYWIKKISI